MDLYRIIAKNTIHRLTFVLVSILGPLCFCQDAIRNAANKYPADTVNFGFCGDANSFVRSLFQTSLAKTVLSSVLIEEIRILRQKLELEALPSDKVNLLQADFESLGNQVAEVFSGVIEFAVLGRSNGNHWVLEIELDRTNQDIDIIVESLQKKQRWLGFHYSPFDSSEWSRLDAKNEREDIYLAGELTSKGDQSIPGFTVFFMLDDRRLVVSSCPAVLSKAVKGELASLHSSGSLASKRQFLEVLMRASSGSICVPASLFVYVDPTEKYAQFLRQTEKAESESKTSIGFGELSAYGGTLALGVNGLDYEIQGYLSHTIPNSPLFDLLSARGNTTPVFEGIPSDVDYYMNATLNPQALFALYSHLENDSYTNAEPLNRLLFGIVCQFPIFAFLSKAEISADCFSGQMDAYGYDYDEPISGSSFCTRLGLMPGNTVIEKFIVPISDATEKFSFDGVGYYRRANANSG